MIPEANAPSTFQVPRAGQVRKCRKKAERLRARGRRDRRAERTPEKRPVFHKVRRDVLGGQRGDGNKRTRRVRRPDPRTIHIGKPDPHLTGVAGLVGFGAYLYELGIDRVLHELFNHLKTGKRTVYVMGIQLRLLIDLFVVGEFRIFGLEALAADPLFVRLCGGVVPSLETMASGSGATGRGSGAVAGGSGATGRDFETVASGSGATGRGSGAVASGSGATGRGSGAVASGSGATGRGSGAVASGSGATGHGFETVASGSSATGRGSGVAGRGSGATGHGFETVASGSGATGRGSGVAGRGSGATGHGFETVASGSGATGRGSGAVASGSGATGHGSGARAVGALPRAPGRKEPGPRGGFGRRAPGSARTCPVTRRPAPPEPAGPEAALCPRAPLVYIAAMATPIAQLTLDGDMQGQGEIAAQPAPPVALEEIVPTPAAASAPSPSAASGMRTARVAGVSGRRAKIALRGQAEPVDAAVAPEVDPGVVADALASGDAVLVELCEGEIPLIVAALHTRRPREIRLKATTIQIEGEEEVLVRAGRGALRIRSDGEIEVVGSRISAASRGLFRIVGRILRLN